MLSTGTGIPGEISNHGILKISQNLLWNLISNGHVNVITFTVYFFMDNYRIFSALDYSDTFVATFGTKLY